MDERTGKRYTLQLDDHGHLKATDLKQITAGGDGLGLRTYDPGCAPAVILSAVSLTNESTIASKPYFLIRLSLGVFDSCVETPFLLRDQPPGVGLMQYHLHVHSAIPRAMCT